ncbi:15893_t:CDS:1 [Gigaspora rosea]|nr:15893_t:CDS:1 [Gigaspora rosea]
MEKLNAHKITQWLFYLAEFAKIRIEILFEKLKLEIREVLSDQLVELPEKLELILEMLINLLPFDLPIIRKQEMGQIVRAMRQVFMFSELLESYFAELLIPLPDNPFELEEEWRKNFPITEPKELQCLEEYVQELRERYNFKRLPDSYFDLLEEKLLLPCTP